MGTEPERAATLKTRRFTDFYDGAKSWSRTRRIIARVEAGEQGVDVRYVVTNLQDARPKTLYERTYCERGQMENFIKSYKTHLAADRTSCHSANANQFRLILHMAAYWLLWGLRSLAPKKSIWRTAQFDTIRLRLLKIAARIDELRTVIRIRFPSRCPVQPILRCLAERTPRLLFLT